MRLRHSFFLFSAAVWSFCAGSLPGQAPVFRAQEIDTQIQIGYGLAIADVQGDGKPDILLADKTQFVWYENPTWKKHVIAENLTVKDNVCIAARDLDGDGKCEIAVGAEWNPSDTVGSGAVFYLVAPEDRTQKWEAVKLHAEPTTHRMKWVQREKGRYDLVVVPLHGVGNKSGEGAGVKILAYQKPADPKTGSAWTTQEISNEFHLTHNFDVLKDGGEEEELLVSGKEGWKQLKQGKEIWPTVEEFAQPADSGLKGVGEIRRGRLGDESFVATIEPMHGNSVALYRKRDGAWKREVLDDSLQDGHALGCGDLLGLGKDQIVVGWRAMANKVGRVGIKVFVPDADGQKWSAHPIDDNTMACEDLVLADLNGDGKLEVIAAGRRTQNVKIYWNER